MPLPPPFFLLTDIRAFLSYVVYPPRSMDNPESGWRLDDVSLCSFMANYPPMPEHLRRKRTGRRVAVKVQDSVSAGEAVAGVDVEVEGGDTVLEDVVTVESDREDDIPLSKRKIGDVASPSSEKPKRARRHLVKKHSGLNVGVNPEADALNVPVSI